MAETEIREDGAGVVAPEETANEQAVAPSQEVTKMLTKSDILGADDLPSEVVSVPEWGGSVTVRTLTSGDRDGFELLGIEFTKKGKVKKMNRENMRARLCAFTVVDEQGQRMFTDDEVEALGKKSAAALERVFEVAQRLNGMGVEGEEIAEAFFADQDEDSPSD